MVIVRLFSVRAGVLLALFDYHVHVYKYLQSPIVWQFFTVCAMELITRHCLPYLLQ